MMGVRGKVERLLSAAVFAEAGEHEEATSILRGERAVVLALVRGKESVPVLTYAINAARRSEARLDILLFDRDGLCHARDAARLGDREREIIGRASVPVRVTDCVAPLQEGLMLHGQREKEVLFFVADPSALKAAGIGRYAAAVQQFAERLGKPLVQVDQPAAARSDSAFRREASLAHGGKRRKPVGKMLVMGIISIVLYAYLLTNQDVANSTFGKGGWYAFLPIITAFVFSFVHGSFTGDFWTVLGIEAAKKKKEVQ